MNVSKWPRHWPSQYILLKLGNFLPVKITFFSRQRHFSQLCHGHYAQLHNVHFKTLFFFFITVTNRAMHGLIFRFSSPVSACRLSAMPINCTLVWVVAVQEFLCTCLNSISRVGSRSDPLRHVAWCTCMRARMTRNKPHFNIFHYFF